MRVKVEPCGDRGTLTSVECVLFVSALALLHMTDQFARQAKSPAGPRRTLTLIMACALSVVMQMVLAIAVPVRASDADQLQPFREGRHVLMIRHANAPGNGDPAHFRLGDCDAQRNLDNDGRVQARTIGAWLRAHGVTHAQIYSSQWCRCLETARLLDLGDPIELPALNSFYEQDDDREPNLRALREFLNMRPPTGRPIVLVTHQVTISAITGRSVSSGNGVLVDPTDPQRYQVRARLRFDQ
ncbi:MAG: phosphohistidine phosphatase SixA [Gammaproteobacteria bacterium]|jgi:phosphohistidine phosphatase SixA